MNNSNAGEKKPIKIKWYLHPKDAHSNEVLARVLLESQTIDTAKDYLCSDGKKRFLYQTPDHAFAQRILRSQKQLSASFIIFCSQEEGKPFESDFDKIKKKTRKPSITSLKKASNAIKLGATMPKHRK